MTFLDIITFASYGALTADVLFQIRSVHNAKSVEDISIAGLYIRQLAIVVILYKFFTLAEWALLLGQVLLAIIFTLYLILVVHYRRSAKHGKSNQSLREHQ